MITETGGVFVLDTRKTTYAFQVTKSGHLQHLYYGRKIHVCAEAMAEQHAFAPGNTTQYAKEFPEFSLEDMKLEYSALGKGDMREPAVCGSYADGNTTLDFVYEDFSIAAGKAPFAQLPGSHGTEEEVDTLTITCRDKTYNLVFQLHYYVFADCDVITRNVTVSNAGTEPFYLTKLMSMQLDFDDADMIFTTFHGAWIHEMNKYDTKLTAGKIVSESLTGTSSSRANPFVMVQRPHTTEDEGDCYGCNLIYSGSHYEAAEVSPFGKLRLVSGIQPQTFSYTLEAGESFVAPEAVLTYAANGRNGMSQNMHAFVRRHIIRAEWQKRQRPILINSWEAAYFHINEHKLLRLAKAAKNVGIELFVMDDGWFGNRDSDAASLGDWQENKKKLPGGLSGIAEKIKALGMQFGIWVEPEMVNVDSDLYRRHPEWVIEVPGAAHAEGRNQRILDLTQEAVQTFVIEEMSRVFSSADISYVKWDMNRNFSDYFSKALPPQRQGEVAHRYVCGLYHCMDELTKRFPDILFEGCASGGNRFDLGILCYFPQIWASDNTDALCRASIQNNYSYGYPPETMTAHVSDCPNHQTLRNTPLTTRFAVASFATSGYECNLCDMSAEEVKEVQEQIAIMKQWRGYMQGATFYRSGDFSDGNFTQWCLVSPDKTHAIGLFMQNQTIPNMQQHVFYAKGLEPEMLYHFSNRAIKYSIKEFGGLVNTVSPIHIKHNSIVQDLAAKVIKMDGETEDVTLHGDTLMYAGVHLKQAFSATGYNEQVRHFTDYAARLYFMEAMQETESARES